MNLSPIGYQPQVVRSKDVKFQANPITATAVKTAVNPGNGAAALVSMPFFAALFAKLFGDKKAKASGPETDKAGKIIEEIKNGEAKTWRELFLAIEEDAEKEFELKKQTAEAEFAETKKKALSEYKNASKKDKNKAGAIYSDKIDRASVKRDAEIKNAEKYYDFVFAESEKRRNSFKGVISSPDVAADIISSIKASAEEKEKAFDRRINELNKKGYGNITVTETGALTFEFRGSLFCLKDVSPGGRNLYEYVDMYFEQGSLPEGITIAAVDSYHTKGRRHKALHNI